MAEFWPFYLHEHSRKGTRALHLAGTAIALACIVLAIVLTPWFLLGGLVAGYAFAWVAHFFVEHNRPATFTYPFKSFASDWVMFGAFLTGQLGKQLSKHGVRPKARA
ncbi:MAG: Mpo1-like protein [Thermoplasmatota archaeon]